MHLARHAQAFIARQLLWLRFVLGFVPTESICRAKSTHHGINYLAGIRRRYVQYVAHTPFRNCPIDCHLAGQGRTIPPLLKTWAEEGRTHGGVIFVDERTISPADIGGLVRALGELVKLAGSWDWMDRVVFLQR